MQKNNKCRLYDDREETIDHVISECRKLAQNEFKNIYKTMRKVIHWDFCQKFEFVHIVRKYIYNSESVLKNETDNII